MSSEEMTLVIASSNVHKVRELQTMLRQLATFDIRTLAQYPSYSPPAREGLSLPECAAKKAVAASEAFQTIALADSSALIVPALGPGPYIGTAHRDVDLRKELLDKMLGMTHFKRAAYLQCSLAIATPEGKVSTVSATCEGLITEHEKGGGGSGYDPIFVKYDYDQTFAQLDEATRCRVSHRAKAFEKLRPALERLAPIRN